MKKTIGLISFIAGFACSTLLAQQPWRFHIAFEDGTGARDTLWIVFDNTATTPYYLDTITFQWDTLIDYHLGEGPAINNPNEFNVFIYNALGDSTKTNAFPYYMYPNISSDGVGAINYTYPIIIRWDTSLFNAPYLPNNPPGNPPMNVAIIDGDYQFFVIGYDPTSPYFHTINMLTKDSLLCPKDTVTLQGIPLFGSGLGFVFFNDPYLNTEEKVRKKIRIFPNPSKTLINLVSNEFIKSYFIFNSFGSLIFFEQFSSPQKLDKYKVPFYSFNTGIYIVKLVNNQNQAHYEKFIFQK